MFYVCFHSVSVIFQKEVVTLRQKQKYMRKPILLLCAVFLNFGCSINHKGDRCENPTVKDTVYIVKMPDRNEKEDIHEYYSVEGKNRSAVAIGYRIFEKSVGVYIEDNTRSGRFNFAEDTDSAVLDISVERRSEQVRTFPVDDKTMLEIFNRVMSDISQVRECSDRKHISVDINMRVCGEANLNLAKEYWKTRKFSIQSMQQSLFQDIIQVLEKYGYKVCEAKRYDFYPISVRDMRRYHIISDSYSPDELGVDGIVVLKGESQ